MPRRPANALPAPQPQRTAGLTKIVGAIMNSAATTNPNVNPEVGTVDAAYQWRPELRTTENLLRTRAAREHLTAMPAAGESRHMIVSGRYDFWSIVPATLELIDPAPIEDLTITTLSLSRDNADEMLALYDAGRVRSLALLCSTFFTKTNAHIFDPVIDGFRQRGQRILGARSHAKLILIEAAGGHYVYEGSGNLRSSRNIEQCVLTNDQGLYRFHKGWIDAILADARKAKRDRF